jgi:hypothetical protein
VDDRIDSRVAAAIKNTNMVTSLSANLPVSYVLMLPICCNVGIMYCEE